jgi:hypothetical protein
MADIHSERIGSYIATHHASPVNTHSLSHHTETPTTPGDIISINSKRSSSYITENDLHHLLRNNPEMVNEIGKEIIKSD